MSKKYAFIHPTTREYEFEQDREVLIQRIAAHAAETYKDHYCNGALVTIVETNEDGSETWRNAAGVEVLSPAQIEVEMRRLFSLNTTDIPVTVVGE
jgi:hypothetical protein